MKKSWRITQSAMAAALGSLVLFLGHSLQFGEFFWYLLASALLLVALVQTGYLGGFLAYAAMLAVTFLLTSDLFFIIPFAILGLIPFVEKFLREAHVGKIPTFIVGMLLFDATLGATFLIFENRLLSYLPEALDALYPTNHHIVLYLIYLAEAFVIGFPSYLVYSFGLAKANLKLRFLLKKDQRRETKSAERDEKGRQKESIRQAKRNK